MIREGPRPRCLTLIVHFVQVRELQDLATLILDLQKERAAIAFNTYTSIKLGESIDLTENFLKTDKTLAKVPFWKLFFSTH